MANAYPTAAEDGPPGLGSRAQPISPTLSSETVAPGERDYDSDVDSDIGPMQGHNPFRGANVLLERPSLYPELPQVSSWNSRDGGAGLSAPQGSYPGADLSPERHALFYPETSQDCRLSSEGRRADDAALGRWTSHDMGAHPHPSWELSAGSSQGEPVTAEPQGSLPPPPAVLDQMSWAIEPRSNSITAEHMRHLSVKDTAFADLQPMGVNPYAVNPANRGLTNGRGLAQAIERAAGPGYRAWCQATVDNRPSSCLDNGEVVVSEPYHLRSKGYAGTRLDLKKGQDGLGYWSARNATPGTGHALLWWPIPP